MSEKFINLISKNGITIFTIVILIILVQLFSITHLYLKISYMNETVKTKKLIVVDDNENTRIVISNSIDSVKNRKRNDLISGILFLDSNGTDKLTIGTSSKVSINGKIVNRIENDYPIGVLINDDYGNERLGLGFFKRRDVVLLGMDGKNGKEGIYMFLAEKELMGQKVGLFMSDQISQQVIYLGRNIEGLSMLNLDNPNKSRLSISIDSSSKPSLKFSNYKTNEKLELIK